MRRLAAAIICMVLAAAGSAQAGKTVLGIASATASQSAFGETAVEVRLDDAGQQALAEISANNIGEVIEIFVDGRLLIAPMVRESIIDGVFQLSGGFSQEEAEAMAARLSSGNAQLTIKAPN